MPHFDKTYFSFKNSNTQFFIHKMTLFAYAKALDSYVPVLNSMLEKYEYDVIVVE